MFARAGKLGSTQRSRNYHHECHALENGALRVHVKKNQNQRQKHRRCRREGAYEERGGSSYDVRWKGSHEWVQCAKHPSHEGSEPCAWDLPHKNTDCNSVQTMQLVHWGDSKALDTPVGRYAYLSPATAVRWRHDWDGSLGPPWRRGSLLVLLALRVVVDYVTMIVRGLLGLCLLRTGKRSHGKHNHCLHRRAEKAHSTVNAPGQSPGLPSGPSVKQRPVSQWPHYSPKNTQEECPPSKGGTRSSV